jgi:hypothetical protein
MPVSQDKDKGHGMAAFLSLEANLAMRPCTPLWSMPADV